MNFNKLFVIVLLAALAIFGQAEAGGLKKFGKKLEGVGKRVFKASEKALPVVTGFKALGNSGSSASSQACRHTHTWDGRARESEQGPRAPETSKYIAGSGDHPVQRSPGRRRNADLLPNHHSNTGEREPCEDPRGSSRTQGQFSNDRPSLAEDQESGERRPRKTKGIACERSLFLRRLRTALICAVPEQQHGRSSHETAGTSPREFSRAIGFVWRINSVERRGASWCQAPIARSAGERPASQLCEGSGVDRC
ncbi:hypothetical protein quinque_014559 [Culex quinquefasciatus]